jgi:hypothetical protein
MADSLVDYDGVQSFYVAPDDIVMYAKSMEADVQIISDSLDVIVKTLSHLNLGWSGKTAQEAKDFGDRWTMVAKDVFGSKDHPEKGKLNLVLDGVYTVASLFATGEQGLKDFFTEMTTALASGGSNSGPPTSITDATTTAVTETF